MEKYTLGEISEIKDQVVSVLDICKGPDHDKCWKVIDLIRDERKRRALLLMDEILSND